jgi:hypothetical protein
MALSSGRVISELGKNTSSWGVPIWISGRVALLFLSEGTVGRIYSNLLTQKN